MLVVELSELLDTLGFSYDYNLGEYIIKNIEIVECESRIESVTVGKYYTFDSKLEHMVWIFKVYCKFKEYVPSEKNFGLNITMSDYTLQINSYRLIRKIFDNESDFIEELHRLNCIGLNIKG